MVSANLIQAGPQLVCIQDKELTGYSNLQRIHQNVNWMLEQIGCFGRDFAAGLTRIVIKPNLVTHRHYMGGEFLAGSVISGAVLGPLIECFLVRTGSAVPITVADNPVEGADFSGILEYTGLGRIISDLASAGYSNVQVIDLRPQVMREDSAGKFQHYTQSGDPLGYVEIDLGRDSMLTELDSIPGNHYYTLADSSIDHFDPRFSGESRTDRFHCSDRHAYLVSRTILNADLIVNVAKLKTHCKAGVSLCLKNMIGMVYLKECMPHHRPGPPPTGDAFPQYPAAYYVAARKGYRWLRERLAIHKLPGFRRLRDRMQQQKILIGQHIEHGNWFGNDTIWRTILDLNRIALYADKDGIMRDTRQRRMICLIDGIVGQEGEGPMAGKPVKAGVLLGGWNPVLVDAFAAKLMGIDYRRIPQIARAKGIHRWPLLRAEETDLTFPTVQLPNFGFKMPKGWC